MFLGSISKTELNISWTVYEDRIAGHLKEHFGGKSSFFLLPSTTTARLRRLGNGHRNRANVRVAKGDRMKALDKEQFNFKGQSEQTDGFP